MKAKYKSGFSLIEVMVAALLLAVLALGGAAVLYHTGAVIQVQETKRKAIDQSVERLEVVKRSPYGVLQPASSDSDNIIYFIDDGDGVLVRGEINQSDAVKDLSQSYPMITKIERILPTMASESEVLLATVTVIYRAGEDVVMESVIIPDVGLRGE